jgi:hypothetical protein
MKKILIIICVLYSHVVIAQKSITQDKLYYFITKDSMVGVRNQFGKVIITPRLALYFNNNLTKKDCKKEINANLIYMDIANLEKKEPHSCGEVYNRKGEFLFAPFFYDNGPDYVSEGLIRFVKNGKVGFANFRTGEIIIEAKYDYADIFNYGIVSYCNGCVWKNKGEHSFVTGGVNGYINKKGAELVLLDKPTSNKDQIIDSTKFIPYQFSYNTFEQKIIDSFYKMTGISKATFVNYYPKLDSNEKKLHYEIVERPSKESPYYQISTFSFDKRNGYYGNSMDLNFSVSADGKKYYYAEYFETNLVPLKKWLTKYISDARAFLKTHPDSPNPF